MARYHVSASTTTVPVFKDTPDARSQAILSSVFGTKRATTSIIEQAINGANWRMGMYYHYGKNHYIEGLPKDLMTTEVLRSEQMENFIASIEGPNFVIENIERGYPDDRYFVYSYLYKIRNYNRYTNEVVPVNDFLTERTNFINGFNAASEAQLVTLTEGLISGVPVDRVTETETTLDGEAVTQVDTYTVTQSINYATKKDDKHKHSYDSFSKSLKPNNSTEYTTTYLTTCSASFTGVGTLTYQEKRVRYYRYDDGSVTTSTIELLDPVTLSATTGKLQDFASWSQSDTFQPEEVKDYLYFIVEYYTFDASGKRTPKYYFSVDPFDELTGGAGNNNPDGLVDRTVVDYAEADYYPVVQFIELGDNRFGESHVGTRTYDDSIALMEKLQLDALHLSDAIQENPDIDKIDEAQFMLAVRADSQEEASLKYLSEYFQFVYENIPEEYRINVDENNVFVLPELFGAHKIEIKEGNVKVSIDILGTGIRTVEGVLGKVGTFKSELVKSGDDDKWFIREQITKTTYREIYVHNAVHENQVYGDGFIRTTIREAFEDEENQNFIFPLKQSIVVKLDSYNRQALFYQSANLVVHAYEKTKAKWYESAGFRTFLIIIAVVTLITTGIEIYTAAAAATTATAAAIAVAKIVLTKYLISVALEYVVELIGIEAAFVVALALFVAGSFDTFDTDWASLSATELMQMSSMVSEAISTNLQEDMLEFQQEVTAFQDEASDLMDELEQKKELLSPSKLIDPFYFIDNKPYFDPSETPTNYYNRTLQTNVAEVSYASIEHFVDVSLTLPTPKYH